MIKGVGTDIIEISRIQSAMKKNRHSFLKKIFTDIECEFYEKTNNKYESVAAGFASKEAVMKVLGTGLRGFTFKDIQILRDDLGKPYVRLYGGAMKIANSKGIASINLSVSHCKQYAVAFAVAD